jgi:hypothetical protein
MIAATVYALLWAVLIGGRVLMHLEVIANKKAATPEPQEKVQDWRRCLQGMKF